ncbi:MAG: APC family permease [Bacteroidetes bacterium]|nr:MAG: APC family permease [Bacteroidota bacterium]
MERPALKRELSLLQAVAVNMIDMVGIGPFVVLPIVIGIMGGPQHVLAWVAGAVLAMVDGFIWAEYGAALPRAGGSYVFLKEAYGPRWGRLMSFLFIWQTMIQAPLVIASGSIGFAQYLSFLVPLDDVTRRIASGSLVILLTVILYRRISTLGRISVALWAGVLATMAWFIIGGLWHFDPAMAFSYPPGAFDFGWLFWVALGQATVQTMYSYLGYYNVNHLGGEIRDPARNIPRAIFISIAGIALLYIAMQFAVIGVIPWQEAKESPFIVSTLIERLYGSSAAALATVLVLWIAFASLFAVMLGYSRIPYAAAADGNFFPSFARLHPVKDFPHISLLWLGGAAFVFSLLFRMADVIKAILAMRILVQFIGGAAGVMLLRRRLGTGNIPYRMWLYPLPVVLAIVLWASVLASTGASFALSGLTVLSAGVAAFMVRARIRREWPFTAPSQE